MAGYSGAAADGEDTEDRPGIDTFLLGNFAGVRIDGSNATIIGSLPGEFKADRNDIPRVWMDHGAWPLLTTQLYIDRSGDLEFLLREQNYFKDRLTHRTQAVDTRWSASQGTEQRMETGEVYTGSVLEHMLVQHVVQFFNVGEHNIIRLEGADWNDGMDMAKTRGESVTFSALYAGNLRILAQLIRQLADRGIAETELSEEVLLLLDSFTEALDYDSVDTKVQRLNAYFERCKHTVSGLKIKVKLDALARTWNVKADWLGEHIRKQEMVGKQQRLCLVQRIL